MLMSRISRRISSGTLGLPPRRLDFQRQNDRNPARCQRTMVSGRTTANASTMPGAKRYSPTKTNRSKVRKTDLFGDLRRSTLICCRRTRISASSRALERNNPLNTHHSSTRTSAIGHEHHPNRPARRPYKVSDRDRSTFAPDGREPPLLAARQPRRAVVSASPDRTRQRWRNCTRCRDRGSSYSGLHSNLPRCFL